MSESYQEFERLLADPNFWEADLFRAAEEIVPLFDAQDWNIIRLSWHTRDPEYKQRFFLSIGDAPFSVCIEWGLDLLGTLEPDKMDEGLHLLSGTLRWSPSHIGEKEIDLMAKVWQANPSLRSQIQGILWSAGKSGQLRRLLGLARWSDAPSLEAEQPRV